jgi:hypothetical protein
MPDNGKIRVPLNESFDYLRKSLNHINIQQSTGPAPVFYPLVNGQGSTTPAQNQPSGTADKPKSYHS